jgi:sulfite oxidase
MMPWGKRADLIVRERVPFNAEPPGEVLAGGAITALDAFYCRNHGAFLTSHHSSGA